MTGFPGWKEEECEVWSGSHRELRWEIILAYLRTLERMTESVAVDTELPYSKQQIKCAIVEELQEGQNIDLSNYLEIAYVQLEAFIPYDEYRVIADFKHATDRALEMAYLGDPSSIIRSARIIRGVKGERAVKIQERISENMRQRQREIRALRAETMPWDAVSDDPGLHCPQ